MRHSARTVMLFPYTSDTAAECTVLLAVKVQPGEKLAFFLFRRAPHRAKRYERFILDAIETVAAIREATAILRRPYDRDAWREVGDWPVMVAFSEPKTEWVRVYPP